MTTSNIQVIGETVAGGSRLDRCSSPRAALLLFGGTIGKSAQFPLYVWLPDAMAGPTPVSALIHAATMVAAGIYLVARTFEVFVSADPIALTSSRSSAAITLLLAALLALVQDDIKKVLAYSTISQLAYMVAALGMGEAGYPAAMFHLFTHAFFKALLFLGAGSVIHAVHSNNMSDMGGLRKHMRVTYGRSLIGSLALAGVPPFSGFFSKDEIILAAKDSHTYWLAVVLLLGAVLTAFYTTRMVLKTFFGEYRGHEHLHESPRSMTVPLVLLAVATCVVGLLGLRATGRAVPRLGVLRRRAGARPIFSPLVALALDPRGRDRDLVFGYVLYRRLARRRIRSPGSGRRTTLLEHKYYLDDFYWNGIVRPIRDTWSAGVYWFNQHVLDGVVNGAASGASGSRRWSRGSTATSSTASSTAPAARWRCSARACARSRPGKVQWYAVGLFAGVIALTIFIFRMSEERGDR